jgi:hypothetical protein
MNSRSRGPQDFLGPRCSTSIFVVCGDPFVVESVNPACVPRLDVLRAYFEVHRLRRLRSENHNMPAPGNAVAPPPLGSLTLRQNATDYPAINPEKLSSTGGGRNALITGSGRGIGKAIALAFAQAGYNVGKV